MASTLESVSRRRRKDSKWVDSSYFPRSNNAACICFGQQNLMAALEALEKSLPGLEELPPF